MDLVYFYLIGFGSLLLGEGECGEWECKISDEEKAAKNAIGISAPIPVNRDCDVAADEPMPNLKCWVGIESVEVDELVLIECNNASSIEIDIPYGTLRKKFNGIRTRKFGVQSNGEMWPNAITSWACSSVPHKGTVTKDCIPENHAPEWYKKPIPGPAPGPRMRKPGCNGMVCYCNHKDGCNGSKALLAGLLPALVPLLLVLHKHSPFS